MRFALELNNLSKIYYQQNGSPFKAVDNLSLHIPQGQVIGFLGPNGAGKTTTIKMICDIIAPSSGTVRINGTTIKQDRNNALASIGAVLEGARNVYWQLSPMQNLHYFGRLKGMYSHDLAKRADYLLNNLDLWNDRDEQVGELSRGTQQKVAIACALITDPPIILLDEPTLGLDVKAANMIKSWIVEQTQNHQKTVVLTTHRLDMAEQLCERIAIIHKGKLIADKPTQDLLTIIREEQYQITVAGKIQNSQMIFPDMSVEEKEDQTRFIGAIVDQDELYKKLTTIQNLNVPLISVTRAKHNLEEVFIHLTQKDKQEL